MRWPLLAENTCCVAKNSRMANFRVWERLLEFLGDSVDNTTQNVLTVVSIQEIISICADSSQMTNGQMDDIMHAVCRIAMTKYSHQWSGDFCQTPAPMQVTRQALYCAYSIMTIVSFSCELYL